MSTLVKFLLLFALLAVLGGCKMADLSYTEGKLSLQVDNNHLSVNGSTIKSHKDSFGNLYLDQKTIKLKDGSIVVYERVRTDNLYEFNLIPLQTIHSVFDAHRVISIYNKSSFYLFQLVLRDGRILNVAAEEFDDQRLTLVYGFSNAQLRNILKQLDPRAVQKPLIEKVITLPEGRGAIYSKWSVQKVQFVPLITPVRYIYGL